MTADDGETTVNESFAVTIPASVRSRIDIEPGDRLRWHVDEDDQLVAEVRRERYGVAETIDPIDMGDTDAVETTEEYDWS